MRATRPVDGVLQAAGDAPVVLGGHEQHRIHCGDRILERAGTGLGKDTFCPEELIERRPDGAVTPMVTVTASAR